jgi:hypothetical protein
LSATPGLSAWAFEWRAVWAFSAECWRRGPEKCGAFVEFVDVWEIQADFEKKVEGKFNEMIERVAR